MLQYFVGGVALGVVLGVLVGGVLLPTETVAFLGSVATVFGVIALAFVGGLFLGSRRPPARSQVRFSGRVFDFPQAPIIVEIALKRMKAVVGRE